MDSNLYTFIVQIMLYIWSIVLKLQFVIGWGETIFYYYTYISLLVLLEFIYLRRKYIPWKFDIIIWLYCIVCLLWEGYLPLLSCCLLCHDLCMRELSHHFGMLSILTQFASWNCYFILLQSTWILLIIRAFFFLFFSFF